MRRFIAYSQIGLGIVVLLFSLWCLYQTTLGNAEDLHGWLALFGFIGMNFGAMLSFSGAFLLLSIRAGLLAATLMVLDIAFIILIFPEL